MSPKKIKVVYISGSRSDYGLMKRNLYRLDNDPSIELNVIITGMHCNPIYDSYTDIEKDEFKNIYKTRGLSEDDSYESVPIHIAHIIFEINRLYRLIRPDVTVLLGDRSETLAGAINSAFMNIPIIHIGGGHISGNIDDCTRHAISQYAHIHIVSSQKSKDRLIAMGEQEWRIHLASASGVDSIKAVNESLMRREEICKKLDLDPKRDYLVALHHPVDTLDNTKKEIHSLISALSDMDCQVLFIYPNLDPGGQYIINEINKIRNPGFKKVNNLNYVDYLSAIKHSRALIGNSSSGIIETPAFKVPFILIGSRQNMRECSENVIKIENPTKESIKQAINFSQSDKFKNSLSQLKNPYDNGMTSEILLNIIKNLKIDMCLLRKEKVL